MVSRAEKRVPDAWSDLGEGVRLDPTSRVPLYHQLFLILRNRIYAGKIAGGTVPGEQELAAQFGISRITAKRALNELARAGLVIRERGRGTRVVDRPPPPIVTASIEGWLENASFMGIATEAQVLEFTYVPADSDVARALEIAPGTVVQRAVRVRLQEGEPLSYLVTYVPEDIGHHYGRADLDTWPLLHLLERAGVAVTSACQTISATIAEPAVAEALCILPGSPLIDVRRTVRDAGGRPVEFIRVLYRPDLYRLEMSMRRVPAKEGMRWMTQDSGSTEGGRSEPVPIHNQERRKS